MSAQEPIPDETIPEPYSSADGSDPEKVNFPSHTDAIPTFSVAFGDEVPPPNQMFAGRQRGPRFFSETSETFDTYADTHRPSVKRTPSSGSLGPERDQPHLSRQNSRGSERSLGTADSSTETTVGRHNSQSSQSSQNSSRSKRWVIE